MHTSLRCIALPEVRGPLARGVIDGAWHRQRTSTTGAGSVDVPAGDVIVFEDCLNDEDVAPAVETRVRGDASLVNQTNVGTQ
jgi:hypothetical protein